MNDRPATICCTVLLAAVTTASYAQLGKATPEVLSRRGNVCTNTLGWRTGDQVLEWMCEDYNDEWLPGGADFNDQVGSRT
jgi:hypothetical protein